MKSESSSDGDQRPIEGRSFVLIGLRRTLWLLQVKPSDVLELTPAATACVYKSAGWVTGKVRR